MRKDKIIETLKEFPDEFSPEDLIERIIFIEKVEKGIKDINEGRVKTLEEVKEQIRRKWLK